MKKVIWKTKNKLKQDKSIFYLSKKDINHLDRIYTKYNLQPESFDEVQIDYLCDREYLIRYIIKELDILLKVGGKFIINSTFTSYHGLYLRSKSQIKYEFSVATSGRYGLTLQDIQDNKLKLEYTKGNNTLLFDDCIKKWSFGIITNGQKNAQVCKLIDSIKNQNIPNYEILICGYFDYKNSDNLPIVSIDDVLLIDDIRAPITLKKNKIAGNAKYENLMIMHDRYLLPEDWFIKMKKYGNYFDLMTMPNIGSNKGRVNDWGQYRGKPSSIFNKINYLLKYSEWSNDWFSQGGLLIIKKSLYLDNMLDERLHWDEMEDIAWSQIGHLKGWFYYLDSNNKIFTFSDRLNESSLKHKKLMTLRKINGYVKTHIPYILKYMMLFRKNLNAK